MINTVKEELKSLNAINQQRIAEDRKKVENIGKSKNTAIALFDVFCNAPEQDITSLYNHFEKLGRKIPRQTITNTMKILVKAGIITDVYGEGGKKWGKKYLYGNLIGNFENYRNNTTSTQNANGVSLFFNNKLYAAKLAEVPTKVKFLPNKTHNKKPNNSKSQNRLFIGDNYDVMQVTMPEYEGSVSLCYADIPYNMGSNRVVQCYDSSFDATSELLTHLYPRLVLMKKLLEPEGLIAVSVSEHEMAYVKVIMDEIFGRSNFVNNILTKTSVPASIVVSRTQYRLPGLKAYLLVYAKDKSKVNYLQRLYEPSVSYYTGGFNTVITKRPGSKPVEYIKTPLVEYLKKQSKMAEMFKKHGLEIRTNNIEKLMGRDTEFRSYMYQVLAKNLYKGVYPKSNAYNSVFNAHTRELGKIFEHQGRLLEKDSQGRNTIYLRFSDKLILNEDGSLENGTILGDIWDLTRFKNTTQSEGKVSFSGSKKPVALIRLLLQWLGPKKNNGLIFEPYGGASVVSHACLLENTLGANYRFVVCQISEEVDPKSEEAKAGFKTVDEITVKRIKNVITELGTDEGFQIFKATGSSI